MGAANGAAFELTANVTLPFSSVPILFAIKLEGVLFLVGVLVFSVPYFEFNAFWFALDDQLIETQQALQTKDAARINQAHEEHGERSIVAMNIAVGATTCPTLAFVLGTGIAVRIVLWS